MNRKLALVPISLVGVVALASNTGAQTQTVTGMAQVTKESLALGAGPGLYSGYYVAGLIQADKCPALAPKKESRHLSSCEKEDPKKVRFCDAFDTKNPLSLVSNLCRNKAINSFLRDANGNPVDYSLFGVNDCRADEKWVRTIGKLERVYIHNGNTPQTNSNTWGCRYALSHYTVARDGTIFQHAGEEREGAHVMGDNARTIGIELETTTTTGNHHSGTWCNYLGAGATKAEIMAACAPTAKQYQSLRNLLAAISSRTAAKIDEEHILGHCESEDGVNDHGHGDPRAFDWCEIGLSNQKKLAIIKSKKTECGSYDFY